MKKKCNELRWKFVMVINENTERQKDSIDENYLEFKILICAALKMSTGQIKKAVN